MMSISVSLDQSESTFVLSDLIQEVEPPDVSFTQKDVPLATVDAMKRTILDMVCYLLIRFKFLLRHYGNCYPNCYYLQ
ncbi:hypothetical protein Ancab_028383 [Ancistrocladus abbreviatus]